MKTKEEILEERGVCVMISDTLFMKFGVNAGKVLKAMQKWGEVYHAEQIRNELINCVSYLNRDDPGYDSEGEIDEYLRLKLTNQEEYMLIELREKQSSHTGFMSQIEFDLLKELSERPRNYLKAKP